MARATDADVRALVEIDDDVLTLPFITSASAVMSEYLSDTEMSETMLTQIEIFLAAHFAVLAAEKGGLRQESVGGIIESYQAGATLFQGFSSTRFGQTAMALDTSGALTRMSKGSAGNATFQVYS